MAQLAEKLARARRLAGYQSLSAKDRERLRGVLGKVGSSVLRSLYKAIGADRELAAKITVPLDGIERRQAAHLAGLISNPDGPTISSGLTRLGVPMSASQCRRKCMSPPMRRPWPR
jgi:hypothetical protein